ncbi:MAG: hypothetical protein HN390_03875 [Anaerolineae bacterium]|jgi:hypothetical protein|nr:hypothetical protein [Anaerolineae bacterium]MBT3713170.1 hypothetical protein [Anaerolineae bacterium]MBT7191380.1 hypothetical protein [Anaerolineae bacterium]MBT7988434.1 hypothetical protein [Anaerolineae bacterium]
MSRIINPNSAGKERTKLTRAVALAVRELAKTDPSANAGQLNEAHDLAAFISLALEIVAETIEVSVVAWEKRNYWVKADKFRMEWRWAGQLAEEMRVAALKDDWTSVAQVAMQVAVKLQKIKISDKHRMGRPWVGSWQKLQEEA